MRSVKTVKVCASFKTGPLGPIGSILQNACLEAMNVIEIIRRMPLCDFEAAMVVSSLYGKTDRRSEGSRVGAARSAKSSRGVGVGY